MGDSNVEQTPDGKWLFVVGNDEQEFETEDEACAAQREYRKSIGLHPLTGKNNA